MKTIDRDSLTGFRQPTAWEKAGIEKYLNKKNLRYLKAMTAWSSFCSVLAGGAVLSLLAGSGDTPFGTRMMTVVLLAVVLWLLFCIRRYRKRKKVFLDRISRGYFEVMDCRAYEVCFNNDLVGRAVIKVYNESGQYCNDEFVIDLETAHRCEKNGETQLLLMRCAGGYYELFSSIRMGVDIK